MLAKSISFLQPLTTKKKGSYTTGCFLAYYLPRRVRWALAPTRVAPCAPAPPRSAAAAAGIGIGAGPPDAFSIILLSNAGWVCGSLVSPWLDVGRGHLFKEK